MGAGTLSLAGVEGIVFPLVNGSRSTTVVNQTILAAAAAGTDLAGKITGTPKKQFVEGYPALFEALVRLGLTNSEGMAARTLGAAREQFRFVRGDKEMTLAEAMSRFTEPRFATASVGGSGRPVLEVAIPYRGKMLRGEDLYRQLGSWVRGGQIEQSASNKLLWLMQYSENLDLRGQSFAVFGGSAEMGVLEKLLDWGATVYTIDIDRPDIWERLIAMARTKPGTMHFPLQNGTQRVGMNDAELAQRAGANVLTQTPEILAWLRGQKTSLTVGHYLYGRGELHTELAMAVDAIAEGLLAAGQLAAFSCLLTPTHTYAIPLATAERSMDRWENRAGWKKGLQAVAGGWFQPNVRKLVTVKERTCGIVNNLLTGQGPNYATAKWVEQMMALRLRELGVTTSANVAVWSWTRSVTQNPVFQAAYAGAEGLFGAEVWQPETSRAMNAASLVYDLRDPMAAANPAVRLSDPLELFRDGAMHGSAWTSAYSTPSIATIAALGHWAGLGRKRS